MKDLKHIDRLFKEKLKDFEVTPNDSVWESIEKELHQKKRKRRVIPIWWQISGVAAVLALLLTVGNFMFNDSLEIKSTNPVVNTEDEIDSNVPPPPSDSNTILNNFHDEESVVNNNVDNPSSDSTLTNNLNQIDNNTEAIANTNTKSEKALNNINTKTDNNKLSNINTNTVTVANDTKNEDAINPTNLPKSEQKKSILDIMADPVNKNTDVVVSDPQPKENVEDMNVVNPNDLNNTIEDAIANTNNINEKEKDEKLSRWNISTNVAPVYFSSFGNGSPLDEQFIGNSKSGELNMSYGINGSYALTDKLKIRTGVNKVNLGYNTNNVIVYRGVGITLASALSRNNNNIKFIDESQNTSILSTQNMSFASAPEVVKTSINSSLNQEFSYIELPIEVEYSLLSKKLGVNVIGGFSTLFLNNNKIYSTLNGEKSLLGEAKNINDTSYSANFGLGLNYNVSDKIKFNLEPTFKYQINTFRDTSGDFKPFFIGFYTGLSYKF